MASGVGRTCNLSHILTGNTVVPSLETSSIRRVASHLAAGMAVLSGLWLFLFLSVGEFDGRIFGTRVSMHHPWRPATAMVISIAALIATSGVAGARGIGRALAASTARLAARACSVWTAAALGVVLVAVGVQWNTRVGGGSDSYGYVSQADLWLEGRLKIPQPWVGDTPPWVSAEWAFSPLGYRPSEDYHWIVPKYPSGYPLLMAAAKGLGGQRAMFWVVPLCGGLLVLATYGLGKRLGMPQAGLMAAWLMVTSPTVLFLTLQPMSDVPVAAMLAVALWCVIGNSVRLALLGGVFCTLAIMIRPNLLPLVAVIGGWLATRPLRSGVNRRHSLLRLAVFSLAALPGPIVTAVLNAYWYDSPFSSGYETLDVLFSLKHVPPNLVAYARSLFATQGIMAFVGLLVWFLPSSLLGLGQRRAAQALCAAVLFLTVIEYAAYLVFEPWWYLRFLLPIWPLMMLGVAMALRPLWSRGPVWAIAASMLVVGLGLHTLRWAIDWGTFGFARSERAYATAAAAAGRRTGHDAVIFSGQHSGTVRYYGGRMTVAYFNVYPNDFQTAFRWLSGHGGHPYALLEDWEVDEFRGKFGAQHPAAALAMTPLLVYHGAKQIYLYDLAQSPSASNLATEHVFEPYDLARAPEPAPAPTLVLK